MSVVRTLFYSPTIHRSKYPLSKYVLGAVEVPPKTMTDMSKSLYLGNYVGANDIIIKDLELLYPDGTLTNKKVFSLLKTCDLKHPNGFRWEELNCHPIGIDFYFINPFFVFPTYEPNQYKTYCGFYKLMHKLYEPRRRWP